MTDKSRICLWWREHMTNARFICHVPTPPQKYGKFNAGSRPIRIREYTTMNNNATYLKVFNRYGWHLATILSFASKPTRDPIRYRKPQPETAHITYVFPVQFLQPNDVDWLGLQTAYALYVLEELKICQIHSKNLFQSIFRRRIFYVYVITLPLFCVVLHWNM